MAEYDRLSCAPVLVIDLRTVLRGDRAHCFASSLINGGHCPRLIIQRDISYPAPRSSIFASSAASGAPTQQIQHQQDRDRNSQEPKHNPPYLSCLFGTHSALPFLQLLNFLIGQRSSIMQPPIFNGTAVLALFMIESPG
ncbi:MAG TPA: hypothetical protein PLE48_12390 [Thiobacillus sp.]|nr:hypothetical protein [Thiobacillus sp.]